jgi:putative transposase
VFAKKRGLARKAGPPVHDDLVDREFTSTATNAVWLTDITEHPTSEAKLYLCAIKDACSKRIVGYSMDSRTRLADAPRPLGVTWCQERSDVSGAALKEGMSWSFSPPSSPSS